jgi:hypothetical protein
MEPSIADDDDSVVSWDHLVTLGREEDARECPASACDSSRNVYLAERLTCDGRGSVQCSRSRIKASIRSAASRRSSGDHMPTRNSAIVVAALARRGQIETTLTCGTNDAPEP